MMPSAGTSRASGRSLSPINAQNRPVTNGRSVFHAAANKDLLYSICCEAIYGCFPVFRLLPQYSGRKCGMMRRIGIALRLETESAATHIYRATLADRGIAETVPRVKLDARLCRQQFHTNPRFRTVCFCGRAKSLPVHDPIMVVSACMDELRIRIVDVQSDGKRCAKIHGRPLHSTECPVRNEMGIDRCKIIRE